MLVISAFVILAVAAAYTGYAKLRLISRYKVTEYLDRGEPRRLYWGARIGSFLVGGAIVLLAYCTHLWWVMVPAWMFFGYIGAINARALRMRFSGRYIEYYRARNWR